MIKHYLQFNPLHYFYIRPYTYVRNHRIRFEFLQCIIYCYSLCLSMLGSNASIAFDTDRLWLFQLVLTVHNTLRRAGLTKYRAWPWSREYSVWPSTWKHGRELPMIFCAWIIVMNPFFIPSHNAMQKSLPSLPFKQLFTSKQTPFNISRLQFVRHPISLLLNNSHGFEAFRNGLLSHSQWSCQFFLILTRVLLK